jgi:hypothetical protein
MRYLRMLTNAVLAGILAAVYLAILFLQVNPHLPLDPRQLWSLLVVVIGFYALHATVLFYTLIVVRQFLSTEVLSPGWLSLRLLSWLSAAAAGAASVLMWLNLRGLRTALAEEAARRLAVGAVVLGLCALALLAIAVVHYSFGRRGSAVGASLFVLAVVASVTLPIVARGQALPRPLGAYPLDVSGWSVPTRGTSRVVMLLLDGASLDYISLATAEGRLPNFGRLVDSGAAMHLATLRPTQPGPVWATVATGKYPPQHGVISTSTYEVSDALAPLELLPDHCFAQALVFLGLFHESPASSASLRSRPLWSILSSQGISVGIVGWPLTHPVQPVRGFLVSDRFHQLQPAAATTPGPGAADAVYPAEVLSIGEAVVRQTEGPTVDATVADEAALVPPSPVAPIWRDRVYGRLAQALTERFRDVRFLAVRYRGLDLAGHRFLPGGERDLFGGVRGTRGDAASLEAYYSQVDEEVAAGLDILAPDDLLIVVSGFGMEPVSVAKRLLAQAVGDPDFTGTHENAPDGFMLAYGSAVEAGRRIRGSVVDVAPTVLYFLGIPVARDIDGVARTDLFTQSFTDSQPITFVRSYDR